MAPNWVNLMTTMTKFRPKIPLGLKQEYRCRWIMVDRQSSRDRQQEQRETDQALMTVMMQMTKLQVKTMQKLLQKIRPTGIGGIWKKLKGEYTKEQCFSRLMMQRRSMSAK